MLDANTGQNDGNDNKTTGTTGDDSAAQLAAYKSELAKVNGDNARLAENMVGQVYRQRQRAQKAEALIPKEGQLIISAEDAELLKVYKKLGTATDIQDRTTKLTQLERFAEVSKAASAAGMNPSVLNKLIPEGALLELGEVKNADGETESEVRIILGDDKTELRQYATTNWPDFLPALDAAGNGNDAGGGQRWVKQSSSRPPEGTSTVDKIVQAKIDQLEKRNAGTEGESFF